MSHDDLSIILESITDGVCTIDRNWKITSFNRAAEEITGFPRTVAIGQYCKDIFKTDICDKECALRETLRTGNPVVCKPITIISADGQRKSVSISTAILRDKQGKIIGGVETFRDLTAIEELRKEIEKKYSFENIISRSYKMREIFEILPQVAESQSTVLIEGESGTGKELIARAIHNLSPRSKKPFIPLNCGALPDTLLESELFGYKSGAFTDAKRDKPGRFALAEGGSLFLDEIGDISPALQVRLLRFLQERVYEPLGAIHSVKANVRVITATNKNLSDMVKHGKFREDLFYRINVVQIEVPPLRARMEDIPILVNHFIARFNLIQDKQVLGISDEALSCLMSYDYPGNIRELENIIERAFVLCRSGYIERKHLPEPICAIPCVDCPKKMEFLSFKEMEAAFLMNALRRNNWNRQKTAHQLGIHKTTLFRKIKSLGLKVPPSKRIPDKHL